MNSGSTRQVLRTSKCVCTCPISGPSTIAALRGWFGRCPRFALRGWFLAHPLPLPSSPLASRASPPLAGAPASSSSLPLASVQRRSAAGRGPAPPPPPSPPPASASAELRVIHPIALRRARQTEGERVPSLMACNPGQARSHIYPASSGPSEEEDPECRSDGLPIHAAFPHAPPPFRFGAEEDVSECSNNIVFSNEVHLPASVVKKSIHGAMVVTMTRKRGRYHGSLLQINPSQI